MHQHYRLTLECGHVFEQTALTEWQGKPVEANYVGSIMPARCCNDSHKVTEQHKISVLTGDTGRV